MIDAERGTIIGSFATGDFPHQNDYSADGKHIYNSSIGNVGFQAVSHANNAQKGNRWLVKVDASTLKVLKTWKFEWGIRPSVITADETVMYAQLSYLNGVIKYDLVNSREIARSDQPLSKFAMDTYATYDEYPHDSAHHGLALSGDGTKLCDCGTIDNTVTIVGTADMQARATIDVGLVPYWATNSPDGKRCFVSLSGDNAVSVIDYADREADRRGAGRQVPAAQPPRPRAPGGHRPPVIARNIGRVGEYGSRGYGGSMDSASIQVPCASCHSINRDRPGAPRRCPHLRALQGAPLSRPSGRAR